jgi:hypothetical protein
MDLGPMLKIDGTPMENQWINGTSMENHWKSGTSQ